MNVDMVQDEPVSSHTHDPVGSQSPIPRKRSFKVYDIKPVTAVFDLH